MDQMTSIEPTSVPFPVLDPELIPAKRYYDEGFFKAESEHLWVRTWQMACRLEQIPDVGDFVEYKILDKSVIVVRTKSGVKAFHNACRHRGVRLAAGSGNCRTKGFICPFHGWRWNMNGENTFVFARQMFNEELLDRAGIDLVACRIEFWGGCAFVNFDDAAPSLRDSLQPVADTLDARNADRMRAEWWRSTVLPVNWKLAMEAFMEGYHVMRTHPQLHAVTVPGTDQYGGDHGKSPAPARKMTGKEFVETTTHHFHLLSEGMGGMIHANDMAIADELLNMEVPEDFGAAAKLWYTTLNAEITRRARARGVPMPELNEIAVSHPTAPVQYMFPNYFLLPMFGNMAAYRIRPLTPESCLFELWSLTLFPEGEEPASPPEPVPVACDDQSFPEIPRQDYSNLPIQQLGLHAQGFDHMRLSAKVEGLISNYQRVIDGFLSGTTQDRLLPAIQLTNGAYEAPIKDLPL